MKLKAALVLLLALAPCAAAGAQVRKDNPKTAKPTVPTARPAPEEKAPGEGKASDEKTAPGEKPAVARPIVCIDPGHPSEVASGRGEQNGTNETQIAWSVALKLRESLEARGYEVVLTKSAEDELVTNKDRALAANRAGAALMVRLHCDASIERGFAVYYPDREGRAKDGSRGPSAPVVEGSRRAAEAVHAGMAEALEGLLEDNGIRTDYQTKVGREQGGALTGSIFSEVPVVTIEMVVLSDAQDAEFIKAEDGQKKMAEAIAEGITRFFRPAPAETPRRKK